MSAAEQAASSAASTALAFTLDANLALSAGAGAGKTYSLVTICLHLLGGARQTGAIKPRELGLLTFTDKAATELRGRLRERLERLASGAADAKDEVDLAAAFSRIEKPFPPADEWRRLRDDLGAAMVGTFHSLCVQLLRRAPAGFGVDPAFELLDERDAKRLLEECAERLVLDELEANEADTVALCADLGFSGSGFALGLVEFLGAVYGKVREEGLEPKSIAISDEAEARLQLASAIKEYRRVWAEARNADLDEKKFKDALDELGPLVDRLDAETLISSGTLDAIAAVFGRYKSLLSRRGAAKDAVKELKYRVTGGGKEFKLPTLYEHHAAIQAAQRERTFRRLLVGLEVRHRHELSRRSSLDFSELLIRARDLLRVPAVRSEVQGRLKALLIDEFQDTNRLQLEIVSLLAEQREGAPRPVPASGPVPRLPLERGFLCAVGDRKQSIYEFRGADVSVFGELSLRIREEAGAQGYLKNNRRSSPKLLEFFNLLFKRVLAPTEQGRDYEVFYDPASDDLLPVRHQELAGAPVERLLLPLDEDTKPEDARALDATAVAKRIAALLADPEALIPQKDGAPRRVRGGDVAILFRRFSNLEEFRQALIRERVPHRVIRGRGFYGAQEVMDLASLLTLLSDPYDALAFAGLLRSPLIGLTDASLFKLASQSGRLRYTDLNKLRAEGRLQLPEWEQDRLEKFLELFERLRRERDRLSLRTLLRIALEETGFRVALAGSPFGEQALVNVDKLLELAGRWDAEARGGSAAFARELRQLAEEEPTEAQAEVLDSGDPRAVQLCTIHAAKGLEWPVVVVPELAALRKPDNERVRFDRRLGLALKVRVGDEQEATSTPHFRGVNFELQRRSEAEYGRLLYVALTRAKDLLILSGQAVKPRGISWRRMFDDAVGGDPDLGALVKDVRLDEIPAVVPDLATAGEASEARVDRAIERARKPIPIHAAEATFPVTQLQDFFLCSRRYLYLHEVGLSEHPMVLEVEGPDDRDEQGGQGAADPRRRGTLAHRLLERVNLTAFPTAQSARRAELEELLSREGVMPGDPGAEEILSAVESFLGTAFARKLQAAGAVRVHRELPFVLRLGHRFALHLKGQIDLLFEDEAGGATIVDYKFSRRHPTGLAAYGFQLDCYALAARYFVQEDVPIRTGIAFLKEPGREPELRPKAKKVELEALESRLVYGVERLLEASRSHIWPGIEPSKCAALRCGFQYRCHGASPKV